jgi:LemA protein
MNRTMGCLIAFVVALLLVVIIGISWYINGVNKVVRLDESVTAQWAQVETVIQRRYDLIPNLVATVKGYADFEKEVLTDVTALRSQWQQAGSREEKLGLAAKLDSILPKINVIVERYPELKASEGFVTFQKQLEGTENRISVERNRYNTEVREFNFYIRSFFGRFFASRRGLEKPAEYYEAAPAAEAPPKVEF